MPVKRIRSERGEDTRGATLLERSMTERSGKRKEEDEATGQWFPRHERKVCSVCSWRRSESKSSLACGRQRVLRNQRLI